MRKQLAVMQAGSKEGEEERAEAWRWRAECAQLQQQVQAAKAVASLDRASLSRFSGLLDSARITEQVHPRLCTHTIGPLDIWERKEGKN